MSKTTKTIHIGADHRGYCLKFDLKQYLAKKGYNVVDQGNHSYQSSDDYPIFAKKVCQAVQRNPKTNIGILICGSGIGMDIAANKFRCLRAALCWNSLVARAARNDDDPHILVLPADFMNKVVARQTITAFLKTPFSGKTKNRRRLKLIKSIERCKN